MFIVVFPRQVKISPLQLTQQIFRQYGVQGLFRGLVPTIMREMPGYFFFFGGYEGIIILSGLHLDHSRMKINVFFGLNNIKYEIVNSNHL